MIERKDDLRWKMDGETRPCRGSRVTLMPYISGILNEASVDRKVRGMQQEIELSILYTHG